MNVGDTIVAIASAAGGAGRGIVRISGKDAIHCLANCFRSPTLIPTKAAFRVSGDFHLEPLQRWLPTSVYVWPTNRSYTGQPTVELHAIGSPPLLESMQETICRQSLPDGSRVRLANRGEFTLRAFLAGRLDLPQAEAVLGMIDSTTDQQFNTALVQMAGGVSGPFNSLRSELLDALAELEAGMDFVDEDIEFISNEQLVVTIERILVETRDLQSQLNSRTDAQELPRIVLCGRPNAGKSTLWNLLVQDQAAIVSDTPGTTRDFLASPTCIGGVRVMLIDTAGVGETFIDPIDHRAQQVSQENQKQAALQIRCVDAIEFEQQRELEQRTKFKPRTEFIPGTNEIVALTKSDQGQRSIPSNIADDRIVNVSSHTGFGIEALKLAIAKRLDAPQNEDSFSIASTASRCRESIRLVVESLSHALAAAENGLGDELIAAELRVALNELATIVGAVYTDDILDRIFSKFCIGK